ncbi:hypothetical protein B9Z55_026423 [Caenorhabditis nigoni]|uniref:PHD-type domain-containing protein n=1 Tax=Caenorhabditis nigoni TaxID=1611254 RepID=A0A2G5T380_9PELO|nr:hypothetical protein B9Z55_026423 [Caenorhabditis nigoni]
MFAPITVNDEIDWKLFEEECQKRGIDFQLQKYLEEGDKKVILQEIIHCIREYLPNEFAAEALPARQHASKLDELIADVELARGFMAIREIIQPKLILRLPMALVLEVQAEMSKQSSSCSSLAPSSSSSSWSSSSFAPWSSAPSFSRSSSHFGVGTSSSKKTKKVMKRKIRWDEDAPFRAPYVQKADYENDPREDEQLVMCETCNQWYHSFCLVLKNQATDWEGISFHCCGITRDRRADHAKAGRIAKRYKTL